jgi:hypothetical protein
VQGPVLWIWIHPEPKLFASVELEPENFVSSIIRQSSPVSDCGCPNCHVMAVLSVIKNNKNIGEPNKKQVVKCSKMTAGMIQFRARYTCNGRCGGGVCGSLGKGSHLGSRGARPARRGKRRAVKRKLIVIGSRGRNQMKDVYGQAELPVMARDHKLSKLYVQAAHEEGHEGTVSTLHRSRRRVWVTNECALAEAVRFHCTECRLKEKRCMEQRMGPLPDHRVELGTIFQSVGTH